METGQLRLRAAKAQFIRELYWVTKSGEHWITSIDVWMGGLLVDFPEARSDLKLSAFADASKSSWSRREEFEGLCFLWNLFIMQRAEVTPATMPEWEGEEGEEGEGWAGGRLEAMEGAALGSDLTGSWWYSGSWERNSVIPWSSDCGVVLSCELSCELSSELSYESLSILLSQHLATLFPVVPITTISPFSTICLALI